jgi:Holliday junction resolvase RusA-like endonuclease
MAEVSFTVLGTPAPQGSKRAFVGKSGRAHVIESGHDRVKSWRQAVVDAVTAAQEKDVTTCRFYSGLPLEVAMVFYFKRPKGHFGTGRNSAVLRDAAPRYPAGKPDLSKLARATEDALTDAGLWADDAQVVRYAALAKYYVTVGYPVDTTFTRPGAVITVRELVTG